MLPLRQCLKLISSPPNCPQPLAPTDTQPSIPMLLSPVTCGIGVSAIQCKIHIDSVRLSDIHAHTYVHHCQSTLPLHMHQDGACGFGHRLNHEDGGFVCRLSRAELPSAILPGTQAQMQSSTYFTKQPSSIDNSASTLSNDSCSEMGDEHHSSLPDDKVEPLYAHTMQLPLKCDCLSLMCEWAVIK